MALGWYGTKMKNTKTYSFNYLGTSYLSNHGIIFHVRIQKMKLFLHDTLSKVYRYYLLSAYSLA